MTFPSDWKPTLIDGEPYAIGNPPIQPVAVHGLTPGDTVGFIGGRSKSGQYNALHRADAFDPPLTYRGTFEYDDDTWLAFEFPPEGVSGWSLFSPERKVFKLYSDQGTELIVPVYGQNFMRVFKPVFHANVEDGMPI